MKKLIALLLALVMVLSLAACGGEKAEAPKADAPKADAPAADGVVTIKLMMSQTQQPGVSAAVEAFNKAYENDTPYRKNTGAHLVNHYPDAARMFAFDTMMMRYTLGLEKGESVRYSFYDKRDCTPQMALLFQPRSVLSAG